MSSLVRLWISLLDGEAQVERDFAHVRQYVRSCKTLTDTLLDDLVILKLSGPQIGEEVATKSACGDLLPTAFTLRCVERFRYLYGARLGIVYANRKPRPKSEPRKTSFRAVKRSVVLAAQRVTKQMCAENKDAEEGRTRYGVANSFFCEPTGERNERTIVWNHKLQRFSTLSKKKKQQNELMRCGRSSFPKWTARSGFLQNAPLPYIGKIAFMPAIPTAACGAVPESRYAEMGYTIQRGLHGCRTATILIVDTLERLHEPACPSQDWVIAVVYMVAKGIPITTAACCNAVGGDVRKLPRSHIVDHDPAIKNRLQILYQEQFKRQHRDVIEACSSCAGMPGSMWEIKALRGAATAPARGGTTATSGDTGGSVPASGGNDKTRPRRCEVSCLNDIWQLAKQLRRVRNVRTAPVVWRKERVGM